MSLVKVLATPVPPYTWPMDTYPGFAGQTNDFYTNSAIADPVILAVTIPSVWSSSGVNFNLEFVGTAETTEIISVTLTTPSPNQPGLVFTQSSPTLYNVSGSVSSASGEFYRFLLRNNTYANLPPLNDEDWLAVIQWNPASQPWEKESNYTFEVEYEYLDEAQTPVLATESITISQYQYWSWEPSLLGLQTLAAQGEL